MKRLAFLALLLTTPALGQEARAPTSCASLKKKDPATRCKDLNLEGIEVDGGKAGPDGQLLSARPALRWGSLIRVRVSMTDEILRSAERITR